MASISVGSVTVDVVPSVKDFATKMRQSILPEATKVGREAGKRIQEGIDRAVDKVQIRVDMGRTMAQLTRLHKALDKIDGRRVDVALHVEMSGAVAEITALNHLLNRIDGRRIRINIETGRSITSLLRLGTSADRANSSIGGLGVGMGALKIPALTAAIVGASTALVSFAAHLAPVIGLTAALPIVLSSAVAGLGTLILALRGTGEAFGAALGTDAAKFEESLEGLAPAAQAAARELRSVRPALAEIQQAAQQAMFEPLRGEIAALVTAVAGPLRDGVQGVAAEFGAAARSVLQFTASARTVQSIRDGFDGLRQSVALMRPALVPVLAGFRDLSIAGVPSLLRMSSAIADVGQRFGEWMSQLAASGRVTEIVGSAADILKQIGVFLADLGGIIGSVFGAAQQAGAGLFGVFGPILSQLNAFLKTASAQQAMTAFFQAMSVIGSALAQVFVGLAKALAPLLVQLAQGLAPIVTALVPVFQTALAALSPVISALIAGLQPAIASLVPLIGVLVGAIGQILQALAPILPILGQFISQLLAGLLPVLSPIITLIAEAVAQVGGALVQALQESLPSIQQVVLAVASLLPALMPLIPLWAEWLTTMLPILPPLLELVAIIVTLLAPVLRFLIGVFVSIATTLGGVLIPIFRIVVAVVTWVAGILGSVLSSIVPAVQWVGRAALWLWNSAIKPAFNFIATIAKWLYSILVVAVIGPILLQFRIWATVAKWLWKNVLSPAFKGIAAIFNWVWKSVIQPVMKAIEWVFREVIAPVFRWIYNSIIKPIWDAVGGAIRWVWEKIIKPVFDKLREAVEKHLAPAFRKGVDAISKAWDKLKSAARKPVAFVVNTIFNKGIVGVWNAVAKLVPGVSELSPIKGFARGGVYPGYTPGRDVGFIGVSGGEAIMRPEWTRAVGPGFVDAANAAARRGGVGGVSKFMSGLFGGNFFLGGVVDKFKSAAKGFFVDGLKKSAQRVFNPLLELTDRTLGDTGFGQLAGAIPRVLISKILEFFGPLEARIGGDGRKVVKTAEQYVGVSGNPNKFTRAWGMNGLPWCGMFVSEVFKESGATKALSKVSWPPLVSTYTTLPRVSPDAKKPGDLALYRGDAGHINIVTGKGAVTIGGNESNSVRRQSGYVNSASSIRRPAFARGGVVDIRALLDQDRKENRASTTHPATLILRDMAGLKTFDSGGWLPTGTSLVYNGTGAPEPVLTDAQWARLTDAATGGDGDTHYHAHLDGMTQAAYEQQVRSAFGAMQVEQGRKDRTGRRR